jgi:hypothetical protein
MGATNLKGYAMPAKARPGKKGVYFELDESLIEAMEAHLQQRRPKIAKNAFAAYAFEELLAKEGAWPVNSGATVNDAAVADDKPAPKSRRKKARQTKGE